MSEILRLQNEVANTRKLREEQARKVCCFTFCLLFDVRFGAKRRARSR